jgi:cation:H+ antiporter
LQVVSLSAFAFALGAGVSLGASWILVSRIERMGGRLGVTDAMIGLLAALAADAPEITTAVSALAGHQQEVGAGVVMGSNVFNLAALLGLGAVAAGWVALHRRVVVLTGAVSLWIAVVCVVVVLGWVPAPVGLLLVVAALAPYIWLAASRRRSRVGRWLSAAIREEEMELHPVLTEKPSPWDFPLALVALVLVVSASIVMERAATSLGRHFAISGIVVGAVVLAAVTSLPNAVAAIYLARRGRGTAMLSTALNSNALNVAVGFLLPATLVGLGVVSSREVFVSLWYLGLTVVVLVLAYRDHGLRRHTGLVILAAYGLFVVTLVAVARAHPSALVLAGPTVLIVAWTAVLLVTPPVRRPGGDDRDPLTGNGKLSHSRRDVLNPQIRDWSAPRLALLGGVLVGAIAAIDALLGSRVVLVGLLVVGPCCGVLTRRGVLAGALSLFALACALAVAIPDGIWLSWAQLAFTLGIGIVALVATAAARAMERSQRRMSR